MTVCDTRRPTRHGRSWWAASLATLTGAVVGGGTGRADDATAPTIEAVYVLDEQALPLPPGVPRDEGRGYRLGGLSDLVALPDARHPGRRFLAVTDRGPNAEITIPSPIPTPPRRLRTLPVPDFSPLLVELRLAEPPAGHDPADAATPGRLEVVRTTPLRTASGRRVSGRPVAPLAGDAPVVHPVSGFPLPPDPDGFDTEGLARLPDGTLWVADEYVPSLARLAEDGRVLERFVPLSFTIPTAGMPIRGTLPDAHARRRENRGYEALAATPDGRRLYACMQSPLSVPDGTPGIEAPLVEFDPRGGRAVREHDYRLGTAGADADAIVSADGKLSALTAIDDDMLLVVEQSATESRLYRITIPADGAAPGPLDKTLVADLAPLVPRMARDIDPSVDPTAEFRPSDLKIEGVAALGEGRVALINDNDFDVAAVSAGRAPHRRSCLWILRLPSR